MDTAKSRVKPYVNCKLIPHNTLRSFVIVDFGTCVDCDAASPLTLSQWGERRGGDLVCVRCEIVREYEYGLPLVDPD